MKMSVDTKISVATKILVDTKMSGDTKNESCKTTQRYTPTVYWDRPVAPDDTIGDLDEYMKGVCWPMKTSVLCHQCCHSFDGIPVPLPQSYDRMRKIYHCRGNFCSWQCAKAYNMSHTINSGRGNRNMYIALLAYTTWVKYKKNASNKILDSSNSSNKILDSSDLGSNYQKKNMEGYAMYHIDPSPPKELLICFGGKLSIEEYRKGFFGIIPPDEAIVGKPFLTTRQKLLLPFMDITQSSSSKALYAGEDLSELASGTLTQKMETSVVHRHSNAFCDKLNRAKSHKTVVKRKRKSTTKNTLMSTMGVTVQTKKR